MKQKKIILIVVMICILSYGIIASEFGKIYSSSIIINKPNITNYYNGSVNGTQINNCSVDMSCGLITYDSELAYIGNCSGADCVIGWGNLTGVPADLADGDDVGAGSANCTVDQSCSTIMYFTDYASIGYYTTTNHSAETHAYINNCSVDMSCGLITYDSELAYIGNCSGADCDIGWGNLTGVPAGFADGIDNVGNGSGSVESNRFVLYLDPNRAITYSNLTVTNNGIYKIYVYVGTFRYPDKEGEIP